MDHQCVTTRDDTHTIDAHRSLVQVAELCSRSRKNGPTPLSRQALYSVYVHLPPETPPMDETSMFARHVIDQHVLAKRFSHTMIDVRYRSIW